jgi:hypothetical protein
MPVLSPSTYRAPPSSLCVIVALGYAWGQDMVYLLLALAHQVWTLAGHLPSRLSKITIACMLCIHVAFSTLKLLNCS